jgi:uncharacterized phage-associated protein
VSAEFNQEKTMATAFDVALYILEKHGPMSAMKLQKLVFYSQAWSLVWDDSPIFENAIQAWANGPVVPDLYNVHRGKFQVDKNTFAAHANGTLTNEQKDTIDTVLKAYGDKSMQWLSDQTHAEAPWKNARTGLADGERGEEVITHEAIAEYYSALN